MRKAIFYIVAIILVVLLSTPQFWTSVNNIFNPIAVDTSQLNFKSLFGNYSIYLNGNKLGDVNDKETKLFPKIKPGKQTIKISRNSNTSDFYFDMEKEIDFIPGTQVDIEWEAGPTLESSNGIIRYFADTAVQAEGTEVQFYPFPPDASVEMDSKLLESKKVVINDTDTHKISIKANSSYEGKDFDIEFNSVKKDLRHVVEIYLYKVPFIQE